MNMTGWVKTAGVSVLLIAIVSIIIGKFKGLDSIDSTSNTTLASGQTLLGSLMDYVEIGVLILVGVYFFKKMTSKGGMGA